MNLPFELVNCVFSFVGSDTAPLVKSFIKDVGEKYEKDVGEWNLERDFFTGAFVVGHQQKLLKNGKVFLWSSIGNYDEFEKEIFGYENRSGEEQMYNDYLMIVEEYSNKKNYYLMF